MVFDVVDGGDNGGVDDSFFDRIFTDSFLPPQRQGTGESGAGVFAGGSTEG